MRTNSFFRVFAFALGSSLLVAGTPRNVVAQSGAWVATISQLPGGGGADVTVESRNDKQSRVKIVFRNIKRDMAVAWDIAEGNCRDEGKPIAPQAAFGKIQIQMDGAGTGSANIPKLESGKRYYVRVFDPQTAPTDAKAYGCANISEKP